jgi:hypothetical protein
MEITASLFGDMLPASLQQPTTQGYSPDYYGQMQQYYSGYMPGQQLNTAPLQDWYGSESNIPYGGTSFAQRAQPSPATQPTYSVNGNDSSGGGDSSNPLESYVTFDLLEQLQNLNNPLAQGLLSLVPFGLGGAIGGYANADAANQLNDIVGLYGGSLGEKANLLSAAAQGLFGMTPDSVQAAGTLAGQFDNMGQLAGYMQAGTDPVLGSIVNSLAERAPNGLTAQQYGTIAQAIGEQINNTLAANPSLSYADAAAVTSFGLGLSAGPTTAEQTKSINNSFAESLATPAPAPSESNSVASQAAETGMTTNSQGQTVSNDASIAAQDAANFGESPSSNTGPSSSKIVCTAMNEAYGFGSFRNRIWLKYAATNLTKAHEVGYHTLFLPLVDLAYKKDVKPLRAVLENIARHRSSDLRAEMRNTKRDNLGRAYRAVLEPLCYFVGKLKGY